jgi:hypothetical protein
MPLRRGLPTNEIGFLSASDLPLLAPREVKTRLANRPLDQSAGGVEWPVYSQFALSGQQPCSPSGAPGGATRGGTDGGRVPQHQAPHDDAAGKARE